MPANSVDAGHVADQPAARRGRSGQDVQDDPGGAGGGPADHRRRYWLVVVWPNAQTSANPLGEYTENVIVHHQVHIQGVGPGGFDPAGTYVPGSIIDGCRLQRRQPERYGLDRLARQPALLRQPGRAGRGGGDGARRPVRAEHLDVDVPADLRRLHGHRRSAVRLPGNINEITGGITTPYGAAGALITQGGGIYVHSNVRNMQVTDNVIRGNGGSYGGGVRVGTPYVGNNRNFDLLLARNQIRDNGGTNLAGGIGLFSGSDGYQITGNAICGNFSAEYGGAISAFGYNANGGASTGGSITKNRIWFNSSYDEGGGIMIAGELPADPTRLSDGTGPVTIDANVIQANLANDDGGGIRLLQASGSHISRSNPQTIAITEQHDREQRLGARGWRHRPGRRAFVDIVNNTVAKNLTTATAVTSDGNAAPAGLSTAANSDPLQARLRNTSLFPGSATLAARRCSASRPLLNDVFWDNRAGTFSGGWVYGIGGNLPDGSPNDVNNWDMGVVDVPGGVAHADPHGAAGRHGVRPIRPTARSTRDSRRTTT